MTVQSDDRGECELCGGCGEVQAMTQRDQQDQVGCPACIAAEKNEVIERLQAEIEQLRSDLASVTATRIKLGGDETQQAPRAIRCSRCQVVRTTPITECGWSCCPHLTVQVPDVTDQVTDHEAMDVTDHPAVKPVRF